VSENSTTLVLQAALDRLRSGDLSARDELIAHGCNRFLTLTRKMLHRYPRLRNWEESGDVAQNALLRLRRALEQVQPASCREFFGLATVQISRELLDLTRHYYGRKKAEGPDGAPGGGPCGRVAGAIAQGMQGGGGSDCFQGDPRDDEADDPLKLAAWREFHEAVQKLPANEREVFELLWYQGLSQEEAAELLGCDRSTVKRRWRGARTSLHGALRGWLPDGEAAD
jgi:RNA polymerase sigma-70 factor (ECF subfamily)